MEAIIILALFIIAFIVAIISVRRKDVKKTNTGGTTAPEEKGKPNNPDDAKNKETL